MSDEAPGGHVAFRHRLGPIMYSVCVMSRTAGRGKVGGGCPNGLFFKLLHARGLSWGVLRDDEFFSSLSFLSGPPLHTWARNRGPGHVGVRGRWPFRGHLAAGHAGTRWHVRLDTRGRGHAWTRGQWARLVGREPWAWTRATGSAWAMWAWTRGPWARMVQQRIVRRNTNALRRTNKHAATTNKRVAANNVV